MGRMPSVPSGLRRRGVLGAPAVVLAVAAALMLGAFAIGCGDSDDSGDDGPASRPAPSASEFPPAEGKTLDQLLGESAGPADLVVSPAGKVLRVGENRFAFGVFNVDRSQVTDAEVALYAAPGQNGPAAGPFPARIESLATDPAFRAKTTADDPDAALAAYISDVDFDKPGRWSMIAMIREGEETRAIRVPLPAEVGEFDDVPKAGDKAPSVDTPTADEVADISEIDTRVPPGTMHDDNLADVLGKKPVVLVFATPALCQSRVCGPVVDVAEQVKEESGAAAAFIHQEVYVDNDLNRGLRPQLLAYNLPTEPWAFVIDRDGVISDVFEGTFSVEELGAAVDGVTG